MRCPACNSDVTYLEGDDLCSHCKKKSFQADYFKDYVVQEDSFEGETPQAKSMDNYNFKRNKDIENLFDI